MKLIWIVCNESLAQDVREILDGLESIDGYTVWEGLYGSDKRERKSRWGDAVWPGLNWAFWVTGEPQDLQPLVDRLKELKETPAAKLAGIKAWMQDVDPLI
jgi:hypothetical protein